jgi:fatty acid desaturase
MDADSLAGLRAQFMARGWHRKATARIVTELLVHLAIALGGIAAFIFLHGTAVRVVAMLVATSGTLGVATNTHTSSHYATSNRRWVNEVLTYFGYPFFLGLSATAWRNSHIVMHHPAPNVIGQDGDIKFQPFAATDWEVSGASGALATYYRMQWLLFPLVVWVHVFLRQSNGVKYLAGVLRDPARRRAAHWWDAAALGAHIIAWYIIPAWFFPVWHVIGFNLLRIWALSYPLFCVVAPGHMPKEAAVVALRDRAKDFVLLQTATTANFRTGLYGRFLCSGLDCQIEHHLFPDYSHVYYPAMSPLVAEFCARQGYPYHSLGWAEAVWKTFAIFYTPKRVQNNLESLRVRPRAVVADRGVARDADVL